LNASERKKLTATLGRERGRERVKSSEKIRILYESSIGDSRGRTRVLVHGTIYYVYGINGIEKSLGP
jgi:hypothetical protein